MRTKEWLKSMLEKTGITQNKLAENVGVSTNAISKIVRGERYGSEETWKKIESYFLTMPSMISYECEDLIKEIKEDIDEFGKDHPCILVYKIKNGCIFFTNYDFIVEEDPFDPKTELRENEEYVESTLGTALKLFEDQNKIIK